MKQINESLRHVIMAIVHFGLAAIFAVTFYDRFWKWRNEIAEVKTSFITPDGGNVTDGGLFWGFFSVILAVFGLIRIVRFFLSRKRQVG